MSKLLQHLSPLQILHYCWKPDIIRSRSVALEKVFKDGDNGYKFIVRSLQSDGSFHIHQCRIYTDEPNYIGPLSQCTYIKTSCDCGRWIYPFEVSQAMRNAADVIYAEDALPDVRNPKYKIGVCKHLIVALKYLIVKKL